MEVHWVDDLVVAGVGAAGAIVGAIVGGRLTRQATLEEFTRVTEREQQGWRRALHFECYRNIKLYDNKPGTETFWEFDTSVLDLSIHHASAFSDEILERMVRATSTNRHLNAVLAKFRATYAPNLPVPNGPIRELDSRREEVVGEVRAIFDALSPLMPTPQ